MGCESLIGSWTYVTVTLRNPEWDEERNLECFLGFIFIETKSSVHGYEFLVLRFIVQVNNLNQNLSRTEQKVFKTVNLYWKDQEMSIYA